MSDQEFRKIVVVFLFIMVCLLGGIWGAVI